MKIGTLVLFVFCCLFFNTPASADGQAGLDIAVLNVGVGARPLGMGGCFVAIADNADAPYWNPAGLGFINDTEITSMQTKLSTDADHYYLSYVKPLFGGTFGVSWVQIGLGNVVTTSNEVDNNNEVVDLSSFSYFSNAYLFSYGKKVNDNLSLGVTTKYLTSDMYTVAGGQATGYSVTPAILAKRKIKDGEVRVGARIDDIVNAQTWGTGASETSPPKLCLGFAYAKDNPGLFAVDLVQTLKSGYSAAMALGYEYVQEGLSMRLGYASSGLSAGAGFESNIARVDYAYVTQMSLSTSNVHRISLSGKW